MPQWKTISQRNWLKGLQATFGLLAQPQTIVVRLSNLLYDKRGALRTTDGSMVFTQHNGQIQSNDGPITEIFLYSPPGINAYYVGIQRGSATQQGLVSGVTATALTVGGALTSATRRSGIVTLVFAAAHNLGAIRSADANLPFNPGNLVVAGVSDTSFNETVAFDTISIVNTTTISYPQSGQPDSASTGGSVGTQLPAGTYSYAVTACDGNGGETPQPVGTPPSVTLTGAQNAVLVTWTPGVYDTLFSVYGMTVGSYNKGRLNPGPGAQQTIQGTSFVDFGLVSVPGAVPPATNTTQAVQVYRMDAPAYSVMLATIPPYATPIMGGIPGAYGGGQVGASAGAGPTPEGGVVGATDPIPQITQFTSRLVFALGNGYQLQQYTDPSIDGTGFTAVPNNFTAQYPDWQGSVAWAQGDEIKDSVSGGLFQAQQSGTSAATRPVFNNTLNATTSDNNIIWKCMATSVSGTPLRGAAHELVFAGSLWVANTWPTTTTDLLDGPNVLKMSDVNNLSSWNPLNIAFIAKDDGDQLGGLATFTIAEAGISPTGSIVVFKNFSTYQVIGVFGASDFAIQQAQTDMGCVAPRSIQFAPGYGIMRFTHLGFAYFNGVADKLVSEEIRPYIFGGQSDIQAVDWNYVYLSRGAQSASPPMYCCAVPVLAPNVSGVFLSQGTSGSSVTMYARVSQLTNTNGIWTEVAITPEQAVASGDQSITISTPAAQPGVAYRLYLGLAQGGENRYTQASTFTNQRVTYASMTPGVASLGNGALTRLICYDMVQRAWAVIDLPFPISVLKQVRSPGTIPLTIAGGYSDGQVRRLFAGDVTWDTGASVAWMFRGAEVFQGGATGKVFYRRLRLRGLESTNATIAVSVALAGRKQTPITQQGNLGANQWWFGVDIMQDALNANATVSGVGQMVIDSMDWQVKPKPDGGPVSAQK